MLERLPAVEGAGGIVIVGISGFGGSGKSTLAAALGEALAAPTVSTDEFATEAVLRASDDWNGIDPQESTRRGLARDANAGHRDRSLWHDVWAPNDQRFATAFDPKGHADVVIDAR